MNEHEDTEFTKADFAKSERKISKEAVIAYESPKQTRKREYIIKKEKKEINPVEKIQPDLYINEDIAPHHCNRKHYKIALAHARRSFRR